MHAVHFHIHRPHKMQAEQQCCRCAAMVSRVDKAVRVHVNSDVQEHSKGTQKNRNHIRKKQVEIIESSGV